MKKKNVLTMALSVSLVGVIAVGGTLAYLSSTTGPVTNTFTFDDSIQIDLKEHPKAAWEGSDWKDTDWDHMVTGNSYTDILPNDVLHKDPTVKFVTVPKNGANLYVSVNGLSDNLVADIDVTLGTEDGGWKKIANIDGSTPVDGSQNGIYAYMASGSAYAVVSAKDTLVPVFTTVTVGDVNQKLLDTSVVIEAYSVQATGDLGVDDTRDELAIKALQVPASVGE